jgi:acyl-CoA synthetase (AMP-forming)/AMP-acid ligase II
MYHMNALTLVLMSLYGHGTVVLLPQFKARTYISAIERYNVTWLTSVPPMIAMMLREKDLLTRTNLSSVRFIRMGSAPVGESLLEQIGQVLPNAKVTNVYGTTEGGPIVFGPHPQGLEPPPLSVGYPHAEVQVQLLDASDDGHGTATGVLAVKSPAVMLGYHNREDLAVPVTPDGFYITGDVFHRDEQGFRAGMRRAGRRRHQGHQAGRIRRAPCGSRADGARHQAVFARARAGIPAPATGLVRRCVAACLHQQD